MLNHLRPFFLHVYFSFIFFGYSCTSPQQELLDAIEYTIELDSSNQARIKIEHLEHKGLEKTFNNVKQPTTSEYVISYSLKLNDRPFLNTMFVQPADKTDSMTQHLSDIQVQLSPNKQHLLVQYRGENMALYHLLDAGIPFNTCIQISCSNNMFRLFEQQKIETPQQLMLDYVLQYGHKKQPNNARVLQALQAQKCPGYFDEQLLDYIGNSMVDSFFDNNRIKILCTQRDAVWRTEATKLVYRSISQAKNAKKPMAISKLEKAEGATNLYLNGLMDYMDNRTVERQVIPQYPLYSYSIRLFQETEENRRLRKKEAQQIVNNCLAILSDDTMKATLPNPKESVDCAVEFLIRYRDTQKTAEFESYIAAIFRLQNFENNSKIIEEEILFPYDTRFSDTEKDIIRQYALQLASSMTANSTDVHLQNFIKKIEGKNTPKGDNQHPM